MPGCAVMNPCPLGSKFAVGRFKAVLMGLVGVQVPQAGSNISALEGGCSVKGLTGVGGWEGDFAAGEVVRMCDLNGTEFARGICDFDPTLVKARHAAVGRAFRPVSSHPR